VDVRLSACLLLALAACLSAPTLDPPSDGQVSCQIRGIAMQRAPIPELDLVIAISDAPAMARHRDGVIAGLSQLAAHLTEARMGLHVAVVGDDPGDIGAYVVDLDVPWFMCPGDCRTRNYSGPLGDALLRLGDVAADGAPAPPLLARIEHALASDAGFLAPDGYLGLLVISAEDDGSPGDAAGYAERLLDLVPEYHARVGIVAGAATPRLDALFADNQSPERAAIDGDWGDALHFDRLFTVPLGLPCLDDNADPDECFASAGNVAMPPCAMATPDRPDPATPLPCFWIARERLCSSGLKAVAERAHQGAWYDTRTLCTCRSPR